MIDLHCHLLPGLDDGPKDWSETIGMCLAAANDGIGCIAATPHFSPGLYEPSPSEISERLRELKRRLQEQELGLEVLPGMEVNVTADPVRLLSRKQALTLNTNSGCLLVELPAFMVPANFLDMIFALKLDGITPIIAHPERNTALQQDLRILSEAVRMGALVQITAGSVAGGFGKQSFACILELFKNGLVHLLATDAHSLSGARPPLLSPAVSRLQKIFGDRPRFNDLVGSNPRKLLAGEAIDPLQPLEPKKKTRFWFF